MHPQRTCILPFLWMAAVIHFARVPEHMCVFCMCECTWVWMLVFEFMCVCVRVCVSICVGVWVCAMQKACTCHALLSNWFCVYL